MNRYTPRFSAKIVATDRWNLASAPSPRHERLISTLRRLESKDQTQNEARDDAARSRERANSRDWNKWRQIAYAEGIEITNGR